MADFLRKEGNQVRFYVDGTYSPTDAGTDYKRTAGTPINAACTHSAMPNNNGRQSAKVDLTATRAPAFEVLGTVEFSSAPNAGERIDYYWAPSTSGTAGNGNVAGNSGSDAACPNGALGGITLDEFLKLCQFIGSLIVHNGTSVQNGIVSPRFEPSSRYGQLIVVNRSGAALATGNTEMGCFFNPLIDEV